MNVCCCFGVVLKVCSQQQKKQLMKCIASSRRNWVAGQVAGNDPLLIGLNLTAASLLAEKLKTRLSLGFRETAETEQPKKTRVRECINLCSIMCLEIQLQRDSR